VRIAEEPAKDKLLAERNNEQIADFFPKIGVVVTQDETFFVEVKGELR
jgi:Mu gam family protein